MRWFTFCNMTVQQDGLTRNPSSVALLFGHDEADAVDTDISETEAITIAKDVCTSGLFGPSVYARLWFGSLIVSSDPEHVPLPANGKQDDVEILHVNVTGDVRKIKLRDHYNACRSLLKAIGCHLCPSNGNACLLNAPELATTGVFARKPGDIKNRLKHGKTKLGEYTYASPVMTKSEDFDSGLRGPGDHDFSQIERWTEMRGPAAKKAAVSRSFRKTNCTRCPLGKVCKQFKYCKGPYPPEPEIIKQVMDLWAPRIATWTQPEWQLWELAYWAGAKRKMDRYDTILAGPEWSGNRWVITVRRTHESAGEHRRYALYAEVQKLYDLPTEDVSRDGTRNGYFSDASKALWLMSQNIRYKDVRAMFGYSNRSVAARVLTTSGVDIMWAGRKHLSNIENIHSLEDMWAANGWRLPDVQHIEVR